MIRKIVYVLCAIIALSALCGGSALAAVGTPQKITLRDCGDANCIWDAYHASETVDGTAHDFIIYCFNSQKHWPHDSLNYAMDDVFYPDDMIHLSDAVKDKLFRVMYAGYPEDSLGLIAASADVYYDYKWINARVAKPSDYVLSLFPALAGMDFTLYEDPAQYRVQDENSPEFAAITQVAFSMGDVYEELAENDPIFLAFVMTLFNSDPAVENIEAGFNAMFSQAGHYATQIAIWRILYENDVPGNHKSQAAAMYEDSLVCQLVDFANGKGPYANVEVPSRNTTFSSMEQYRDTLFENGKVLRRSNNTPVGRDGTIKFYEQADGTFRSEPLHFDKKQTLKLPYEFTFTSGGTMEARLVNSGDGSTFYIVASGVIDGGTIEVTTSAKWPSEVYQYVRSSEQDKPVSERVTQEMSGCFFNTVSMSLPLNAKIVTVPDPTPMPPVSVPQTGDHTPVGALAAAVILSLGALAALKKRH